MLHTPKNLAKPAAAKHSTYMDKKVDIPSISQRTVMKAAQFAKQTRLDEASNSAYDYL